MDKFNFEKLDDNFINLYEEGIFIKAIEYSAFKLNELFEYKLTLGIEKKSHLLYFELGFPKTKLDEKIKEIVKCGYSVRFFPKNEMPIIYNGKLTFLKDKEKIVTKKQSLIKFS